MRSELGEPIHKLATRGILLWKEFDDTIFTLPKDKKEAAIKQKRDYIIKRLNADFQRVWFGKHSTGEPCDLEDMTYAEILRRMVELMYVSHEARWIDVTLRNLTADFMQRIEERFTRSAEVTSFLQSPVALDKPFETVEEFLKHYPEAESQLINAQDVQHFLVLCARVTQKPVPFIPMLDDKFEIWFKRDSLWQSEDLEAVVGQDVGRVAILQGPMSAKYNTTVDQPIKEMLDEIHEGHISSLKARYYKDNDANIPIVEYFGGPDVFDTEKSLSLESIRYTSSGNTATYTIAPQTSGFALPNQDDWLQLLAGPTKSWRRALFTSDVIIQGTKFQPNALRPLFQPRYGQRVEMRNVDDQTRTLITAFEKRGSDYVPAVSAQFDGKTIQVSLYENRTANKKLIALPLLFTYHPDLGFAPIQEVMEGRNQRIKEFYWKLWFGDDPFDTTNSVSDIFYGGKVKVEPTVIADFVHAVGNRSEAYIAHPQKATIAPMDFAIVLGWKAVMKAVFPKSVDGDLLKLLHLSNGFRMLPGSRPLQTGDVVETQAQVNAVYNGETGKTVEVKGTILRDSTPIMEIVSQFFYRGNYEDYENTFKRVAEIPMQVTLTSTKDLAVLQAKEWFHLTEEQNLLNATLTFRLESFMKYKNKTVFSQVETKGLVEMELNTKEIVQVASVSYEAGESRGNPVMDYLRRHGTPIEQPVGFENGGYSVMPDPKILTANFLSPPTNSTYADVSADYNPIHVNHYFADYAYLPGTITHGMWTSAATRAFVETFAAENRPERVTMFEVNFLDTVLPNAHLETKLAHTGMVHGKKIIKVETFEMETGRKILEGTAEIDQPVTAYVFTGQGSQEQGMGMDLYNSSSVARAIWDKADQHFLTNYGFSILDIVKNNPKELTVHFGGPKGKAIRNNYINMVYEVLEADGSLRTTQIFNSIHENSTFYKFQSPTGLLSATQFTQPALTLMEKAAFEDMKSRGLVQTRLCICWTLS